jgi:hypothetical protein
VRPLATEPPATPLRVRFASSVAVSYTFNPSALPRHSPLRCPGTPLLLAYGAQHRHHGCTTCFHHRYWRRPWPQTLQHLCLGPTSRRCYDTPSWKGGLRHHPTHWPLALRSDPTTLVPPHLTSASNHAVPRWIMTENSTFHQFLTPAIDLAD